MSMRAPGRPPLSPRSSSSHSPCTVGDSSSSDDDSSSSSGGTRGGGGGDRVPGARARPMAPGRRESASGCRWSGFAPRLIERLRRGWAGRDGTGRGSRHFGWGGPHAQGVPSVAWAGQHLSPWGPSGRGGLAVELRLRGELNVCLLKEGASPLSQHSGISKSHRDNSPQLPPAECWQSEG